MGEAKEGLRLKAGGTGRAVAEQQKEEGRDPKWEAEA